MTEPIRLATVTTLPVASSHRLTRVIPNADSGKDIDRFKVKRHLMSALLKHGSDGLRGDCYCGVRPRSTRQHIAQQVAEATNLQPGFVGEILALHRTASGRIGHLMHCECGESYNDRGYGREEHQADALAANIPTHEVSHCLATIRETGKG